HSHVVFVALVVAIPVTEDYGLKCLLARRMVERGVSSPYFPGSPPDQTDPQLRSDRRRLPGLPDRSLQSHPLAPRNLPGQSHLQDHSVRSAAARGGWSTCSLW